MLYLRAEKVESIFWLAVDVVGALALFSAGILGLATWRAEGAPRHGPLYWALAGFGLVYLAIDARLSLPARGGPWPHRPGLPRPGRREPSGRPHPRRHGTGRPADDPLVRARDSGPP